jgi:hypothetical protein
LNWPSTTSEVSGWRQAITFSRADCKSSGPRVAGFHGHFGGLEQVGDQRIQYRPGGVVEPGPVGDAELLRHVDLHRLDVLTVPHRGEQLIGEAQDVQVLGGLLAQEMVDPVHLLLVEYRVDDPVQRLEGLL